MPVFADFLLFLLFALRWHFILLESATNLFLAICKVRSLASFAAAT